MRMNLRAAAETSGMCGRVAGRLAREHSAATDRDSVVAEALALVAAAKDLAD